MSNRLSNKVALVTGAGTGIGREVAKLYAEEGASVIVSDLRVAEGEQTAGDIRAAGGRALFVPTDVTVAEQVKAAIGAAEREFGQLDIVTANAGILGGGAFKTVAEMSDREMSEIMDVNWQGVWSTFKYAIPAISRAGGGAMTVTASVAAYRGRARLAAYCASKGAVVALVRALALELRPRIRVNAVAPGSVETRMSAHAAEARGVDQAEMGALRAASGRGDAFGRAKPREVAHAHLFLVSPESSYVTGQSVVVDGGKSVATP